MENPVVKVSKKKQGAHVPSTRAFILPMFPFGTFSHITLLVAQKKLFLQTNWHIPQCDSQLLAVP